ncbi:MAG: pyruvoyl-dependent arginine decarboxylase [Candidatus Altiarchaeota archaeon]
MKPSRFFVTSGLGVSKISHLNSFDRALWEAGIDMCNLVKVSSVLPRNTVKIQPVPIPPGTITYCVLSHIDGQGGERISAGVGWAQCESLSGDQDFGLIAEDSGFKEKKTLKTDLKEKLLEMAQSRNMQIITEDYVSVELTEVPQQEYGSVIAAVILLP